LSGRSPPGVRPGSVSPRLGGVHSPGPRPGYLADHSGGDPADDCEMSEQEHLRAKSLLCAGTTWPGVLTAEDQRALDYLCSRPDVDARRVGCGGLSAGRLRTVYLEGSTTVSAALAASA
jgi:dienelactone hydrolase